MPGPCYLPWVDFYLRLDPQGLRVYVPVNGLQQRRRHRHKIKTLNEALKMDQRTQFMIGVGPVDFESNLGRYIRLTLMGLIGKEISKTGG